MEVIAILLGLLFWPPAVIVWFIYLRKRKPAGWRGCAGTVLVLGMPLLAAVSMGKYMFLDEPLVFAVREGDAAKVKYLLARGADANASFKGSPALEQAAGGGDAEIVRLLLAHGARTDTRNEWNHQTALASARKNGYADVVRILQQAGASQ